MWELSGIPCVHAVAAYMYVGTDLDACVSHWYSRESWFNAYQFSIKPVFGTNIWKRTNDVPLLPPIIRKMLDRPQKKRIQASGETSGSQCASRGGGRSGRGDGNDGSGSGVNDGSGSGVNDGSGSGVNDGSGRGGGRAGGRGKRGGGRAGRGSGRGSRGGVFPSSSSCGILTAKEEYQLELDEQAFRENYHEVFIPNIHSQPTQQSGVWVVDTTVSVADVNEAPEKDKGKAKTTVEDGPAPEQGKSPAVDKGKAKTTVEDGPAPEQGKSPDVDKGKTKASVEDGPAPKKKRG
ncbi:hypothetical protein Tco_1117643 [Tanacetum coccineum]